MSAKQDNTKSRNIRPYFLFAAVFISLPFILGLYRGQTGKILVSTEIIGSDSYFHKSVIYVFDHSVWGAQGIILNRPLSQEQRKEYDIDEGLRMRGYEGGPVGKPDVRLLAALRANAVSRWRQQDLFVTSQREDGSLFMDYVPSNEPQSMLFVGYAGWSPGQLEGEIKAGSWRVYDEDIKNILQLDEGFMWSYFQEAKKNQK